MDLQDTIKWINIYIVGVSEERERKRAERILEEIMTGIFPTLMKYININI